MKNPILEIRAVKLADMIRNREVCISITCFHLSEEMY